MKETVKVLSFYYSNEKVVEENLDIIEAAYGVPELRDEYMDFYQRTVKTLSENIGDGNLVALVRGSSNYSTILLVLDKTYDGKLYQFDSVTYDIDGEVFIDISPLVL